MASPCVTGARRTTNVEFSGTLISLGARISSTVTRSRRTLGSSKASTTFWPPATTRAPEPIDAFRVGELRLWSGITVTSRLLVEVATDWISAIARVKTSPPACTRADGLSLPMIADTSGDTSAWDDTPAAPMPTTNPSGCGTAACRAAATTTARPPAST